MKPKDPVRPAFDLAANKLEAWRRVQLAALTLKERDAYDRMLAKHREQLRDHHAAHHDQFHEKVDFEKKKILLQKPELALRMLPTETMRETRAFQLARDLVNRRHEAERQTMEADQQQLRDVFLRQHEAEREQAQQQARERQEDRHRDRGPDEPSQANRESIRDQFARAAEKDRDPDRDR